MKNRAIYILLLAALSLSAVQGAENLSDALQKGLLEEEANHNLTAAIQAYQSVLQRFEEPRKIAATACFRLGECYRKLGKTNEALAQFERVVRDFPDQEAIVKLSQKALAEAGRTAATATTSSAVNPVNPIRTIVAPDQVQLLRDEIALVEQQVNEVQKKIEVGSASPEDLLKAQRQLIPLELKLPENAAPAKQEGLIKEQIHLIERLLEAGQNRVQNGHGSSADLISLKRDLLEVQRELLAVQEAAKPRFQTRLNTIVRRAEPGGTDVSENPVRASQVKMSPEQVKLLRDEMALIEQQIKETEGRAANRVGNPDAVLQLNQQLLELRRKLPENAAPDRQEALIKEEMQTVQQLVDVKQKQSEAGVATPSDLLAARRDLLELQRQLLAAQQAPQATYQNRLQAIVRRAETEPGLSDEESKEIQRMRDIIQNSPDLINAPTLGPNGSLTPLQDAAAKGELAVARFLLENHADVNGGAGKDGTPLYFAADHGHKSMVELLLANGADVNARSRSGATPLYAAAEKGFQAVAEVLLAKGADVNARTEDKQTPLRVAVVRRQPRMVELLLAHKADINVQDIAGNTALMDAVRLKDAGMIDLLLANHADPNLKNKEGSTALTQSIRLRTEAVTQTLLEHGADPNLEAPYDFLNRRPDGVFMGGTHSETSTPLIYAVRGPNAALVKPLLEHGAEVNRRDSSTGRTALHWAVWEDNVAMVNLLLERGADPNLKDNAGNAPLALDLQGRPSAFPQSSLPFPGVPRTLPPGASMVGALPVRPPQNPTRKLSPERKSILDALLDHKADVNSLDGQGATPLLLAVVIGDPSVIEALLAHGADMKETSEGGITPLLKAAEQSDADLVALLLAKGADVNRKAIHGYTALHVAATGGRTNVMQVLFQNGADANIQDEDGNTPLHYAAFRGNLAAVKMLVAHGAKLDVVDRLGITPVQAAGDTISSENSLFGGIPRFVSLSGRGVYRAFDSEEQRAVRAFLQQAAGQATPAAP